MSDATMNEFLDAYTHPDLDLPQQTRKAISGLLDQDYSVEKLAEVMTEKVDSETLRDAPAEKIIEVVEEIATDSGIGLSGEDGSSSEWASGDGLSGGEPQEKLPTGETPQEVPPTDEEVLGVLVPALAEDAKQVITATEEELFASVTRELWEVVKANLTEELREQRLSGSLAELNEAIYNAAWEAMYAAAEGFCAAGEQANESGLAGYAALLSQE